MNKFIPLMLGLAIISGNAVMAAPVNKAPKAPTSIKKTIKKVSKKSAVKPQISRK
ncbi:MAG: hypothetical protein K2X81_10725 [Candidatus Obscuribacterales bacterium]|nr:hypothetical protein [Candidatus Obscuribacterales bacterium]